MTKRLRIVSVGILLLIDSIWSFSLPSLHSESIIPITRTVAQLPAYHHFVLEEFWMPSNPGLVPTDNVAVDALLSDVATVMTQSSQIMAFSSTLFTLALADETLDAMIDATVSDSGTTSSISNVLGVVQNIAIGITAVLFLLAGLTYLTASVLIPAGAKQLEEECQILIPQTWNEYLNKLEDGQTIQDRPDLMFELGLLLNKAKADQLEEMCRQLNSTELWNKYQAKLMEGQQLQDRPDLIEQLSHEIAVVGAAMVRESCPPELWAKYEAKLGPNETMTMRQDLVAEALREIKEQDRKLSGEGVVDVTQTSTTLTPYNVPTPKGQWDDDNDDK